MGTIHTDWLKARKKQLKVNDETIGHAIGIDRSVVNKIIAGKVEFTPRYADGFAKVLEMTREEVLFRFGVLSNVPAEHADMIPEGAERVVQVPVLGEVPAGAVREAIRHSRGFVLAPESDAPKDSYALKVSGESMNVHAPDGCTIIINPNDKALFPGRRYVIRNAEGEATFKEYREGPARLVAVSSYDHYEDIPLGSEPIEVLGRVTSVITRI